MKRGLQDHGEMLTETQKSWETPGHGTKETTGEVLAVSPSGRRPATCPYSHTTGSHSHLPKKWLEKRRLSSPEENVKQRTPPGRPSTEPSSDGDGP